MSSKVHYTIDTLEQLNQVLKSNTTSQFFELVHNTPSFTSSHVLSSKFFESIGPTLKHLIIKSSTVDWKWEILHLIFTSCTELEKLELHLDKCPYEFPNSDIESTRRLQLLQKLKTFKFHVVFIEDAYQDEDEEPKFVLPTNFPSNFNKFMKRILQLMKNLKELEITTNDYYLDKEHLIWIHDYIWSHHAELFPEVKKDTLVKEHLEKLTPFQLKSELENLETQKFTNNSAWILLHVPDDEVTMNHYQQYLKKLSTKPEITKLTLTCPKYEFVPIKFPTNHSFGLHLTHLILQYWNGTMEFIPSLKALKELELHESNLELCIFYKGKERSDINQMKDLFSEFKGLDVMFSNCPGSYKISNKLCKAFEENDVSFSCTD